MPFLFDNELYEPKQNKARQDKDMIMCIFAKHNKFEQSLRLKVPNALEQQETLSWKTLE